MSFMQSFPRPTKTYHTTTYDRISKHHGFDGKGKSVLVTGGAGGVGFAISKAFAAAGVARIIIISRSSAAQEKARAELEVAHPELEVVTIAASITDNAHMSDVLRNAGPIDVLVLNAAVAHRRALATEITVEEVEDAFATNVVATFNLARTYLADTPLPAAGRKTIINVSAATAHHIQPNRIGYGASKAAAAQIMQSFASQYQSDDVRIFSFHPGSLYTPGVAANIPKNMIQWDEEELPADFAVWLAGSETQFLHGRHLWANYDVDELVQLKIRFTTDTNYMTIGLIQ